MQKKRIGQNYWWGYTVNSRLADTAIKRTAAKSTAILNYRRLTEINSRYYGLLLMRTLAQGRYNVRYKGVDCISTQLHDPCMYYESILT